MNDELIAEIIENIRRGKSESIGTYLNTIATDCKLDGTRTTFYAHTIALNGNGDIRLDDFISFIIQHIIAYVIPRSRFEKAKKKDDDEGLGRHHARLYEEARKLFTPLKTTGEGGEILLFILGEVLLGLPQLFCKMSVKTSGEMHFHGADGIHVGLGNDGKLELYWGESKMHKDFNSAASECVESISPFLKRDGDTDHEDLLLLQTHLDLCQPEYTTAVKTILDKDNPEFNNVSYCGICFIGFDENLYSSEVTEEKISTSSDKWKQVIAKKLQDKKLSEFHIHFFCLPFTSVAEFRKRFLEKLGLNDE